MLMEVIRKRLRRGKERGGMSDTEDLKNRTNESTFGGELL